MTKFEEFENIIARLRAPDGCPWDREQTHVSLKKPCIEEAAEVICGINILDQTGDPDNLKEELGGPAHAGGDARADRGGRGIFYHGRRDPDDHRPR